MKMILTILLATFFSWGNFSLLFTQESADSLGGDRPQKELPPIQLQEYTIVGLSRISLPHKMRNKIFRDVEIKWIQNREIYRKDTPAITFQFSRVKPALFRLYEFPWLDARAFYGSYNTAGIQLNSQFKAQKTLPYLSADFQTSDGHVPNAQWTSAGMQAGLHQEAGRGHLFSVGTDYNFQRRGIWRNYQLLRQDWETHTTLWSLFAQMENQWSHSFSTVFSATYFLDDHKSAFRYDDRGIHFSARSHMDFQNTRLILSTQFQNIDLTAAEGNLVHAAPDSTSLRELGSSLLEGVLAFQQKINSVTARAGVMYQKSREESVTGSTPKFENDYVYPHLSLSLGFQGKGSLYVRYRPGAEITRLRDGVLMFPFSDLSSMRTVDYRKRWEAGVDIHALDGLQVNIVSRYSEADYFPAPVAFATSLNAVNSQFEYPGWVLGTLARVKIQEIYGKLDWHLIPSLRLRSWLNFQQSDIRQAGDFSQDIIGKEVPYHPRLTGESSVTWNFYRRHEISLSANYVGQQYDDLMNTVKLQDYFLWNIGVQLLLTGNLGISISGHNLLDVRYEEWRGFPAAGITGRVGLRWTM